MIYVLDHTSGMKKFTLSASDANNVTKTSSGNWTKTDKGRMAYEVTEPWELSIGVFRQTNLYINKGDLIVFA